MPTASTAVSPTPPLADSLLVPDSELDRLRQDRDALNELVSRREAFYRCVLESLAEGVLITNTESRILFANRRLASLTGWEPAELLGRISYEVLSPPENHAAMRQRLEERLSGEEAVYEHEMVRKDGTRHWVQVHASPYRDAEGRILGTIGTITCLQKQKELEHENDLLRVALEDERGFRNIVGRSPALMKALEQVRLVAPTDATVLVLGQSGTGKELVARALHEASQRQGRPLVRVNCASIPQELFESEFFGHVRGAFTGAIRDRVGRFELADGGTLFLDEIGEIPLDLQAKLLRVLQEGAFERLGEDRTRTVNVRLIAATNRDLLAEARAGRFRLDLYYRLSVFPIELPPLRERREDIALLAESFLRQAARRLGIPKPRLSRTQLAALENYDWPGNVRELQNVIERAAILARHGELRFDLPHVAESARPAPPPPPPAGNPASLADLKTQERTLIGQALAQTGGKIYGPDGAAALLGLRPTTLASKLKRLGLR